MREARAVLAALLIAVAPSLPVVSLDHDRRIRDDPKVAATLTVACTRHRAGVELRGQSSQTFAKKSYAVELRDDAGLLGMPAEDDWVLGAAHADKTLIRNVVGYETAARLGGWAPRTRLVELRRNGRRQGVYVLGERPELGRHRVDAAWLVEMTFPFQARTKGASFTTPITRRPFVFDDPEREDLPARRARAIRDAVVRAERALYRTGGWRRHLDAASAVDAVLVQELLKNVDAFHASTYLHKPRDGRLRLGPVWDLDLSTGNSTCCRSASTRGFITRDRDLAERLWADRSFRVQLARRWRALRRDGLREAVLASVDRHAAVLRDSGAAGRNFRRWPVLSRRVFQEPVLRGSFDAEVRFLRTWLERRIAWLDRQWR
jgi:hypothetical protein